MWGCFCGWAHERRGVFSLQLRVTFTYVNTAFTCWQLRRERKEEEISWVIHCRPLSPWPRTTRAQHPKQQQQQIAAMDVFLNYLMQRPPALFFTDFPMILNFCRKLHTFCLAVVQHLENVFVCPCFYELLNRLAAQFNIFCCSCCHDATPQCKGWPTDIQQSH